MSPGKCIPVGTGGNRAPCGTLGSTKRETEALHVERDPRLGEASQVLLRRGGLGVRWGKPGRGRMAGTSPLLHPLHPKTPSPGSGLPERRRSANGKQLSRLM